MKRKQVGSGTKTNRNSKKINNPVLSNQQKKITQFFSSTSSDSNAVGTNEQSPYFDKQETAKKKITNSTKQTRGLDDSKFTGEVIVLSDSGSDTENGNILQERNAVAESFVKVVEVVSGNAHGKIISSERDDAGLTDSIRVKVDMTPDTDSGEEFLSQIDIDELISSQEVQEQQKNTKTTETTLIKLTLCTPKKLSGLNDNEASCSKQTPTKSPKAKLNKFSPLTHLLRNRSRSRSSNGNSPSPSPSRKSSPYKNNERDQKGTPVKKLQYFTAKPYYLRNFLSVIDSVVHDEHNAYLLNEDDWITVDSFNTLSSEAQCLYVRLFQRKWEWKAASTIKYPLIADNLLPVFIELHSTGFLLEIMEDTPDLDGLLDLLNGEQIVILSKQMKVDPSKKTKQLCKKALINASRQPTLLGSSTDIIVKGALKLLGAAYQIEKERKDLFSRLFILYCPPQYWEDEQDQTANHLLKMLMNETGQMEYPEYSIKKTIKIYSDRNCLLRFHEAWALHCDISAHLESKNWQDVIEIAGKSVLNLKDILKDEKDQTHDSSLPTFLRVYTSGSVLTRVSWLGVDGFQKEKNYAGANKIIEFLLSQEIYLSHYRGRWYERYVINMQHLKLPVVTVKRALENGLCDAFVQNSHKLSLSDRLEKLNEKSTKARKKKSKSSNSKKGKEKLTEIIEDEVTVEDCPFLFRLTFDTPSRSIEGEKMDYPTTGKSVFIGERDSSGSSTASSVELFAIEFYKKEGYKYGLHAEGSAVTSIYGLIFWDEIYNDEINDAFHAPNQAFPLDIHFEDFYKRREEFITRKLEFLRKAWSVEDALQVMEENWGKYFNKLSMVNWSVFPSIDQAKTLVKAMGLQVTAAICERLSMNFRHYRSGFPDLVVWNDEKFLFVEVKGPGDTLSAKQMLWIDFLLSIGASAEVCHVISVSNKRIRIS